MLTAIDVIYRDGEVIGFCNQTQYHKSGALCTLVCGLPGSIQFRFCNPSGSSEKVIEPMGRQRIQLLLSCRDRLLLMQEKTLEIKRDDAGFQLLRIDDLNINTPEMQSCLQASNLEHDPEQRGKIDCEFSVAILVPDDNCRMQLFFTLPVTVKNHPAA
ncbi:MAG: hypothetical protein E7047_09415 [Lentisphaerae bacterium]|nr:hypothetical protein [Lentisphaerota bacterium]